MTHEKKTACHIASPDGVTYASMTVTGHSNERCPRVARLYTVFSTEFKPGRACWQAWTVRLTTVTVTPYSVAYRDHRWHAWTSHRHKVAEKASLLLTVYSSEYFFPCIKPVLRLHVRCVCNIPKHSFNFFIFVFLFVLVFPLLAGVPSSAVLALSCSVVSRLLYWQENDHGSCRLSCARGVVNSSQALTGSVVGNTVQRRLCSR